MPPAMHTPTMHAPHHTCPPATHGSPATYAPAMHIPPSHTCPPAMHAPCHACPPHPHHTCPPYPHPPPHTDTQWTDRHLWKHNLRKLRLRAVMKGNLDYLTIWVPDRNNSSKINFVSTAFEMFTCSHFHIPFLFYAMIVFNSDVENLAEVWTDPLHYSLSCECLSVSQKVKSICIGHVFPSAFSRPPSRRLGPIPLITP